MSENENKTLIIIRGLPGSGKSTLAEYIRHSLACDGHGEVWPDVSHYEADMYFEQDGVYRFNPRLLKEAHSWCQDSVWNDMTNKKKTVIVSNTFVKRGEMKPYLDMAAEHGYYVQEVTVRGPWKSVHGVPEKTIERMRDKWEE